MTVANRQGGWELRINRPAQRLPLHGGTGIPNHMEVQVDRPKLGVQVSVVAESQSVSSWERSSIAGGGASPRRQPSDCLCCQHRLRGTQPQVPQPQRREERGSCPEIRWVELPFPLISRSYGSAQRSLSLLVLLPMQGTERKGWVEISLKDWVTTIE